MKKQLKFITNIARKNFSYHFVTDTDSTCLMLLIIYNVKNNIHDKNFCEVLFEAIVANNICDRFNTSVLTGKNLM